MSEDILTIDPADDFSKELEALFIKHKVERAFLILPKGENTTIRTYSTDSSEELEMGTAFSRLTQFLGDLDTPTINELVDYLEDEYQNIQEETISQVTWETIAREHAKVSLSPEQYQELGHAAEQKDAAISAGNFNDAAEWREQELELLKLAINSEMYREQD
jgi:hypothetical protein